MRALPRGACGDLASASDVESGRSAPPTSGIFAERAGEACPGPAPDRPQARSRSPEGGPGLEIDGGSREERRDARNHGPV